MMKLIAASAALVGSAWSHAHHEQTPIEGPLQGLWYNTLPGDGGTQVSIAAPVLVTWLTFVGGLRVFWDQHLWQTPILTLLGDRQRQIRHCFPGCAS